MTAIEIAAEYFPDASPATLDYIIWEHTGFPEFWHIPKDGATPEACFRSQLEQFKLHGRACYRCGAYGSEGKHRRPVVARGQMFCRRCRRIMRKEDAAEKPAGPTPSP